MKDEMYKKVFINGESDCPKVEGDYFCNRNGFLSVQHLMTTIGTSYMREIRWYLQPLPSSDNVKSAEEILELIIKNNKDREWANDTYVEDYAGGSRRYILESLVFDAIKYAQSHQVDTKVKEVSVPSESFNMEMINEILYQFESDTFGSKGIPTARFHVIASAIYDRFKSQIKQ